MIVSGFNLKEESMDPSLTLIEVVRVQPGTSVELRTQEFSRIVLRLDRIDGVALP
jgi:hypothetical protein